MSLQTINQDFTETQIQNVYSKFPNSVGKIQGDSNLPLESYSKISDRVGNFQGNPELCSGFHNTNSNIKDVCDLMENEQFNKFFTKYAENSMIWSTMTMFMHIYEEIKKRYPNANKYEIASTIKSLIDNPESREYIIGKYIAKDKKSHKKTSLKIK